LVYLARHENETKAEFEEAKNDVINSFNKLIASIDATLKNAPKRL